VLLVIDEAQNLSLPSLEEIRMLSNLETEKSKLLQIILVGQPDLRDKLDRPELEQLRQRITVSYHLEALDGDETAHYVNHRLARASIGAPMEFDRPVTDRIHARSGGVPRLINVIADATLVFGYGEERSEIDAALLDEVITDLDASGVLGPQSNPNRRASVVPADPEVRLRPDTTYAYGANAHAAAAAPAASAHAARPSITASPVVSGVSRTVDEEKRLRELTERELQLKKREADLSSRERELAEQRRVLADQYRLLRSHSLEARPAATATPPPAPGSAPAWPPAPRARAQNFMFHQPPRSSFWRRVKHTVLGTPEPVLEDSL